MQEQALKFLLEQGVACVVCVVVAGAFGFAIVKLFRTAKEERDQATARHDALAVAAAAERDRTRAEFMGALEKHSDHLEQLGQKLQDNTAVLQRVADRIPPVRAA